jgi:FtsP/CotA-like multicopper oxidase with cupredoxin domain
MKARMRYLTTVLALLLLVVFGVTSAGAGILVQCPTDTVLADGVTPGKDGISDVPGVICTHLAAGDGFARMADGKEQYIFSFVQVPPGTPDAEVVSSFIGRAHSPGPTIKVKQDQELYLSLSNVGMIMHPDLFDPHSVHWHGFVNAASVFDGVPEVSPAAAMQATQPYYYLANKEGTFFYHCHVEASEHMQMGMIGNLWVTPRQNELADGTDLNGFIHQDGFEYVYNDGDGSTYYDVSYPVQLTTFDSAFHDASLTVQPLPFAEMTDNYFMINGRGYPDTINTSDNDLTTDDGDLVNTAGDYYGEDYVAQDVHSLIEAVSGDKISLRLSNVSTTDLISFTTTLGVPMRVVGRGAELLRGPDGKDTSYEVNVLNMGGGQAYDVIIDTDGVAPGTYFLYTTNLHFLSNDAEERGGIMTEIVIN